MPIKEKIANTYVSAILNSNGGPNETRTRPKPVLGGLCSIHLSYGAFIIIIIQLRSNFNNNFCLQKVFKFK